MEIYTLLLISFALSLDAFSVALTCGVKLNRFRIRSYLKISIVFGLFQALMPFGGWLIGYFAQEWIRSFANLISFVIFASLGVKTLFDYCKSNSVNLKKFGETFFKMREPEISNDSTPGLQCERCTCNRLSCLLSLAVATSIDAFFAGIVLALLETPFYVSLPLIGVITLLMSLIACFIGCSASSVFKGKAQIMAGFILIFLAIKSLV